MVKVFSYYKVFNINKCVKNYVLDVNGKCVNISFDANTDYLKGLVLEIKKNIPNYTYESYKEYLKNHDVELITETFDEFKERNNII